MTALPRVPTEADMVRDPTQRGKVTTYFSDGEPMTVM